MSVAEIEKTWYVYFLCDSATPDIPFYIGKGRGNRVNAPEAAARKGVESKVCKCIREIWADGREVVKRKVLVTTNERLALVGESLFIFTWKKKTQLVNSVQPNLSLLLFDKQTSAELQWLWHNARKSQNVHRYL